MVPSRVLYAKWIDLKASAAPCSFPYDVRLGEYALLVKEDPADKSCCNAKVPVVHISAHNLKVLPTSPRALFRAS